MKKRVLAALLVTMMTVGTVAGCGSSSKSDDSDKKTTSDAKSDDKKDSGKKVTVVTSGTGEPYSLLSDDGKWTGIDADMWDEIEKRTGWEVEVKQASFDAMWGELDTNRVDVVANCLAVKPERTDKYNATIPYYGDSQCIIVNDDSDYKTADDLKGKTVGCTNGQAAQTIIEDMAAEKGFTVAFGKKPLAVRRGGSIPIISDFEQILGIKTVLMGFGLESDAIHSPNENFSLDIFRKGIEAVVEFHKEFDKM